MYICRDKCSVGRPASGNEGVGCHEREGNACELHYSLL